MSVQSHAHLLHGVECVHPYVYQSIRKGDNGDSRDQVLKAMANLQIHNSFYEILVA